MAPLSYNANPFFSAAFMAPSIGEKIDNATAQAQAKADELKAQAEKLGDKTYNKLQDAKETVKDTASDKPTGADLYARFALAGALGCAITHGALTPVDVVKTRIQLEPEVYNKVSV